MSTAFSADTVLFKCTDVNTNLKVEVTKALLVQGEVTPQSGDILTTDDDAPLDERVAIDEAEGSDEVDVLDSVFEDSLIRFRVVTEDNLIVDQVDFFEGRVSADEEEFKVRYRDGGLFKSHRMTLQINKDSGEGHFEEVETQAFGSGIRKNYNLIDCSKEN